MNLTDASAATAIAGVVGAGTVGGVGLLWKLFRWLSRIEKQLHPNGGSSLVDKVNRIESKQDQTNTRLLAVADSLLEHIVHAEADRQEYTAALASVVALTERPKEEEQQ